MTAFQSCAYVGVVGHTRVRPTRHAFSYKVFSLALDVDAIDQLTKSMWLMSRNRWNILSFCDRDHGSGDGTFVADHVRQLLVGAGLPGAGESITLLCYPRILGFVFNPLSVYFCRDRHGSLSVIIYEVSNTFNERKSYIIPVAQASASIEQTCAKEMYVSPFTPRDGMYRFRIEAPAEEVFIGVDFYDEETPVLKTFFRGKRRKMTANSFARMLLTHPLMILKVLGGIHLEAARLWWKGVPLVARHTSPKFSFSVIQPTKRAP